MLDIFAEAISARPARPGLQNQSDLMKFNSSKLIKIKRVDFIGDKLTCQEIDRVIVFEV